MAKMETAVQDLAVALEGLSAKVERQMLSATEQTEALATTKSQTHAAQKHAGASALGLASAIDDLKGLIARVDDPTGE